MLRAISTLRIVGNETMPRLVVVGRFEVWPALTVYIWRLRTGRASGS